MSIEKESLKLAEVAVEVEVAFRNVEDDGSMVDEVVLVKSLQHNRLPWSSVPFSQLRPGGSASTIDPSATSVRRVI